jgi:hypothetical protein
MSLFGCCRDWVNFEKFTGPAGMPGSGVRQADRAFTQEQLGEFITVGYDRQQRPAHPAVWGDDMEARFAQALIRADWTIADLNLSVFNAGLAASGKHGTFLWFDGAKAPKSIAASGQVFDCVPVEPRGEQLQLFSQGKKFGDCYAMPGWINGVPGVMGWLAMIAMDSPR